MEIIMKEAEEVITEMVDRDDELFFLAKLFCHIKNLK